MRHLPLALAIGVLAAGVPTRADEPAKAPAVHSPLSPQEALPVFKVDPGLRVELVASEPQITSPVAMAFDEDGRIWVAEYRDYPNGPPPGKPGECRIRVLEDRDGDGFYETSTVFADRLLYANGVMPWKRGAVVTQAPDILYLQDTDGDGKADRREVLYEGFAVKNPQHRVNTPILGMDNWVYVASGLYGGQVRRAGRPSAPAVNVSGRDFRFDLVRDRYEAVSGAGQYGNSFDDWGHRFICENHHHIWHVVLPSRYLERNPFLAPPALLQDVSVLEFGPLSSGGRIYPISRNWTTSSLHAGRFTAACGVFIYRGDLLPASYRGAAFTCDPTGNLVHQEVLHPKGATFRSRPAREGVEFFASPDDWFRPVFSQVGPDGALYVVDMYRAVIEHPEYMPPELKNRPDLTAGKDRGRIWRIVPANYHGKPPRPHLGKASTAELVGLLAHPNAWWRTTAQRLLLERQDRSAVEPLRRLAQLSERPEARAHAAWLLEHFTALDEPLALRLLHDSHPRVREQAVRLAEHWLPKSHAVQQRLNELADDPDGQVRFQVALSLGDWDDARILEPLARIALRGVGDHWTREAVASSVPRRAGALTVALLKQPHDLTKSVAPDRLTLLQELATLVGARQDADEVADMLHALLTLTGPDALRWQTAGLTGLADGMGRRGTQLGAFVKKLPRPQLAGRVEALLARAAAAAVPNAGDPGARLAAARLLAHAAWATAGPALRRLLREDAVQDVRLAAVRALAAHPRPEVAGALMEGWASYGPTMRREVTEAMLQRPDRIAFLFGEVQADRVKPGDLDPARVQQLVNDPRPPIRDRARKLLQAGVPEDRKRAIERYKVALTMAADPARGRTVFQKNCATCHKVAGIGVEIGPPLEDYTRTKSQDALLNDILNPNASIDNNYINYAVVTKSGKVLTGLLAAETATSVTLRRAENQTDVVLRQDIEELRSTGLSLMPEGLEKQITVAEMADLLSFLKNWRYLAGDVPTGKAPSPTK